MPPEVRQGMLQPIARLGRPDRSGFQQLHELTSLASPIAANQDCGIIHHELQSSRAFINVTEDVSRESICDVNVVNLKRAMISSALHDILSGARLKHVRHWCRRAQSRCRRESHHRSTNCTSGLGGINCFLDRFAGFDDSVCLARVKHYEDGQSRKCCPSKDFFTLF